MTDRRHRAHSKTRRHARRALLLLLSLTFIVSLAVLPTAAVPTTEAPVSADVSHAAMINLENNLTLYESRNADATIYPAATVKIMTGLLLCRALEDRLGESVTVTDSMLADVPNARVMYPPIKAGETFTVRDLLYAALAGGYNDATCILAYLVSRDFLADMNAEASRLGMDKTHYTNVTGIHDDRMTTSLADVTTLAREAYGNKLFMEISTEDSYTVPATSKSKERKFANRNSLITGEYRNGYCRGMTAGMTDEGGWCVVTVYEKKGVINLCVVMGAKDSKAAYTHVGSLLSWANDAYEYRTVVAAGKTFDTVKVAMTGVSKSKAELVPVKNLSVYLPRGVDGDADLIYTTVLKGGELKAPIKAGDIVGTVTVTYEGRVVGKADLTVTEDFEASGFLTVLMGFRDYLLSRAFLISLFIFVILMLILWRITTGPGGRYGIRSVKRRIKFVRRKFN